MTDSNVLCNIVNIVTCSLRHIYQLDKILERYVSLYNDTVT